MNDASAWRLALARKMLPIAPPDAPARLKRVFQTPPQTGVLILHGLIEETLSLVDTHMPEVDTAETRRMMERL